MDLRDLHWLVFSWTYFVTFYFLICRFIFKRNLKIRCIICLLSFFVIFTFFLIWITKVSLLLSWILNLLGKEFKVINLVNKRRFELSSDKILSLILRWLAFTAWWDLNIFNIVAWIKIMFLLFKTGLRWRLRLIRDLFLTFSPYLSIRKPFIFNSCLCCMVWPKRHDLFFNLYII